MQKRKKAHIHIRLDDEIKQHLSAVLSSNGMSISNAIQLYIWQIVTQNGIPFKGFVSTNLPPKKTDELSELDITFKERLLALKKGLVEQELSKAEDRLEKEVNPPSREKDDEIVQRYITKEILRKGYIPGPTCTDTYTKQQLHNMLGSDIHDMDLSLYIKPGAEETQEDQSPAEED